MIGTLCQVQVSLVEFILHRKMGPKTLKFAFTIMMVISTVMAVRGESFEVDVEVRMLCKNHHSIKKTFYS